MTTKPKPFVFVAMPFDPSFDDLYHLGIKPACEKAGAVAERVDEQIFQESILQRIYSQIAKADVVVADVTGMSPNVFYEIGYAHALGKSVVLLAGSEDDIPFDLKHYTHVVYGGSILAVIPEIEKRVRWALENPETSAALPLRQLRCSVRGRDLAGEPTLVQTSHSRDGFTFQVDIHNSIEERIREVSFQAAFVTSQRITSMYEQTDPPSRLTRVQEPDGSFVHLVQGRREILPGSWEVVTVYFNAQPQLRFGDTLDFALRLFCDGTVADHDFHLRCEDPSLAPEG
jgi:hypothetical protein